jgi:alkyldihydroxyacetonephosphate synthase
LPEELGAALGVVRALKAAWDPGRVLNPGALIPERGPNERTTEAEPVHTPALDRVSALAELPGNLALADAESFLASQGHSLGIELGAIGPRMNVSEWIGLGMPGTPDRFADPVTTTLAGFSARLRDGRRIAVRPSPRRAVGPDLSALFVGMRGAFGVIERASVLALPAGAPRALPLEFSGEREPELDPSERSALLQLDSSSIFEHARDGG